ncbi:MAG: glycerol-3-phosphate 1-O-acyltransferase PlsY [Bacilli bacterium]
MDIILYNISLAIFCLIIGYGFGSIPSGVWIGRLIFKQDPRDFGSRNSGGTNASRLWGFKYGFFVYLSDFLKVAIPLWSVWAFLTFVNIHGAPLIPTTAELLSGDTAGHICQWPVYWLVSFGAVLGHCHPLYAQFQGGKAASIVFSTAIFTSWFVGIVSAFGFFVSLKIKKYISLSSMIGSTLGSIAAWLTCIPRFNRYVMYGQTLAPGYVFAIVMTLSTILLIFRHRTNITRLKSKTERKITFLK